MGWDLSYQENKQTVKCCLLCSVSMNAINNTVVYSTVSPPSPTLPKRTKEKKNPYSSRNNFPPPTPPQSPLTKKEVPNKQRRSQCNILFKLLPLLGPWFYSCSLCKLNCEWDNFQRIHVNLLCFFGWPLYTLEDQHIEEVNKPIPEAWRG